MENIKDRRNSILRLRELGKSYGEISKELNENKSYVAYVCKESSDDLKNVIDREEKKIEYERLVCSTVSLCDNISQVCKKLYLRPTNTNYNRIQKIIDKYDVDTSHFVIDYSLDYKKNFSYTPDEIFTENSPIEQTCKIKNYLFKFNLKEKRCEICGNIMWMNKDIPLQVHHINGNNIDNRLENLQILCPNCHAQTDTYCGKNIKYVNCRNIVKKDYGVCEICGKPLTKDNSKYCSIECKNANKLINNISREELINSFIIHKSFEAIGRYYNVSGKAIIRWLKKYNLPTKKKDLQQYIKEHYCNNI